MKTAIIAGVAALSLLTASAAHASAHLTFLECGPYLIVSTFAALGVGGPMDKWERILDRQKGWNEDGNHRQFPGRMIKLIDHLYYYRTHKCQYIERRTVKETWKPSKVPPWTENKEPPWTDHIQPPKGDGWEDIEK